MADVVWVCTPVIGRIGRLRVVEERTGMSESRLFLGGPLHGRRLVVDADAYNYFALAPMQPVFAPEAPTLDENRIVYTLRRAPGGQAQVFVAPDYDFDTREWLAFDTREWVGRLRPDETDWERLDRWLWRGKPADFKLRRCWTYVLGDGRGDSHVTASVTDEVAHEAASYIAEEMRRELAHHLLPLCVVGGCTEKGSTAFVASESGRLAGRPWKKGDEIRLCPEHSYDVYRAQGVCDVDRLAGWLRPDVEPRYDDGLYSAAAAARYGDAAITRMIRLGQRMEDR